MDSADRRPFAGIKVLDATRVLAGPYAAYQLGLLGAEVLKIEKPGGGDSVRFRGTDAALAGAGLATYFLGQGANKRCIAIDLDQAAGRAVFLRLVAGADVLIENLRGGALARRGLGPEVLSAANARLIHCSITGYGAGGPRAADPAYDPVIQAAAGLMSLTGTAQTGPLKTGAPVIDYATGMAAAFAIAAALHQRSAGGGGQSIDVSMHEVALGLMTNVVTETLTRAADAGQGGDDSVHGNPVMAVYPTLSGQLSVAALEEHQVIHLIEALGEPRLLEDPRFCDAAGRRAHREDLRAAMSQRFAGRDAAHWERLLNQAGVPAARVRTVPEALACAQTRSRGVLQRVDLRPTVAREAGLLLAPFRFAHDGPRIDSAPRPLGADTDAVLRGLGYAEEDIAAMRATAAIG